MKSNDQLLLEQSYGLIQARQLEKSVVLSSFCPEYIFRMIKSTILAAIALLSVATESQARPQIWSFLGGVAVGSALANNYNYGYGYSSGPVYYYSEPSRGYRPQPPAVYYPQSRYYYREPQVVYYGRPAYGRCR